MVRYIIIRLIGIFGVLWLIGTITFFIMHAIPGGPWDEEKQALPPEVKLNILRKYGLDKSLPEQYVTYWFNLLQGDMGIPYQAPTETVAGLIGRSWPISAQLGLMAVVLAFALGIPLGITAALKQNSWIDQLTTAFATLGFVTPNFVLAVFMIWIFSLNIKLFPPGGWEGPKYWVLPVITFAMSPLAITARYTRTAVIDVMRSDYVRTARAKGLKESTVITQHILKNALIPMLTIMGPMAAALTTGSIFVESMFRIPGIGKFFTQSVSFRDYPMIMGVTLFYAALVATSYLITDLLYVVVDPRIDFKEQSA